MQSDVLLVVRDFAVEGKRFELAMGRDDERSAGRLVASARLDADEAVFDEIDAADGVARADFVQQLD